MTILTIVRDAKCKDCEFITLAYFGKRKIFICDKGHTLFKGKNSKICQDDYQFRTTYGIKQIKLQKMKTKRKIKLSLDEAYHIELIKTYFEL